MSLKITINDEEVVSNSNLQIKEEMLSTSSTILKNCYPKSWEEDKDYVSRYYFPKDYSKCKITDVTEYPEDPGITVKGTNLNINYDNSKNWELKGLFGDTLQDGTPTPDTPVEIQNVTGLQNVNVCEKNLFNANGGNITYTNQSVTRNIIDSNNIEITSTYSWARLLTNIKNLKPNSTYTISADITNINSRSCGLYENSSNRDIKTNADFKSTLTLQSNSSGVIEFAFYVNYSGTTTITDTITFSNIQLEQGSATEYEPYKGNTYEVNLGKNLFSSELEQGTILRTGKPGTTTTRIRTKDFINVNSNTTYTLSVPNESNYTIFIFEYNNSETLIQRIPSNWIAVPYTFTTSATTKKIKVIFRQQDNDITPSSITNIQLELGSSATSYSPYFTPIELNDEDSIKKSTGKNLFNKNNANKLDGYINSAGTITSEAANKTIYIPCKSSTTYTVSKIASTRFGIASYSSTPQIGSTTSNFTRDNSATHLTLTTGSSDTYLAVWYYNSNTDTLTEQQILDSIMIEENNQATSYEPYGKVWYIEKQTRKLELAIANMNNNENFPGWNNQTQLKNDWPNINTQYLYNTGFKYLSSISVQPSSGYDTLGMNTASGSGAIYLNKNYFNLTQTQWKEQYPNLIFSVVYYLQTPEYTEITNEELISQLETIYQSQLYNGVNNISVNSENLPSPLEIHYNFNEEYTTEDLIFCGCIKNTGRISLNPREPHYCDLQILDFKTLLSEGDCLNYVISNKTISEAINQVVSSISDYGFIVGNIQLLNPDEIIGAYSTLNKTAYDVFQYFADITQSRWTTRMIDENTIAIDFYDPTLMPQGTQIQSTTEFYENNDIVDISFNYSTNDYRNKQIMTSDEVFANITQTQTIIADGYTKNFMCENKIGLITNITLNGVEQSFITKNEEQLGYSGDFIYQPGENTFISTNTISAGGIIVITYYPIVKGREIILNSNESGRIETQIGRRGVISRYENRNDSTSSQELQKIGQSYIKYKGQAEITLKVVSTKDIWNIGQIVNYNAPLEELTTDYMVKSKLIDMYLIAGKIFYTYELTSNFNYENAVNYFDNQRAKNQGNIGEGETITRNIDLESTALIKFYDTAIEEIQVQNPTSLDFALDGVLI